jgi:hypothetical protein
MAIIEGKDGVTVVDPLVSAETAKVGMDLYFKNRGTKPVVAVIYTHSHVDHYGGVRGVVDEADVKSGKVKIYAPVGFMEAAVAENIMAGNVMSRRASYMYGNLLKPDAKGQVGAGLGTTTSAGTVNGFDLLQERFQFIQRQCGRAIAFGVGWIRVRFDKQTRQTGRHTGARQFGYLSTTTARRGAKRIAALQRVGHVEDNRRLVGHVLHDAEAQHIHNQVVITKVRPAVAKDHLARVANVSRNGQGFFHVVRNTGACSVEADFLHRHVETTAVFRFINRVGRRTNHGYAELGQHALTLQLQRAVQRRLAANKERIVVA